MFVTVALAVAPAEPIRLNTSCGTGLAAVPGFLRDRPHAALAGAVAASALAYALPLAFVSGSAEFRYLNWPIFAALLAPLLLVFGSSRAADASSR